MTRLFKILTMQEWERFQQDAFFKGSPLDLKDGFIHASFTEQWQRVLDKFFKNIRPLILIEIDGALLTTDTLKIEANKPGGEKYPHIYGEIPLNAVVDCKVLHEYA